MQAVTFLQVHIWVNVESMLKACVVGKPVDGGKPPKLNPSNLLTAPQQKPTHLNVTNKPKKIPQVKKKLSVPNVGMLPPPKAKLPAKSVSSLSVPLQSSPKTNVPAKHVLLETSFPTKNLSKINVPAICTDTTLKEQQIKNEKVLRWSQTSKSNKLPTSEWKFSPATFSMEAAGFCWNISKLNLNFPAVLTFAWAGKILMVAVKDCRVSVELMKSLGGSDWSKLGEINDVDQSQGVTR